MLFIESAIVGLPIKKTLKGTFPQIQKENFWKVILLKNLKMYQQKFCGHLAHSRFLKKKQTPSFTASNMHHMWEERTQF